MSKMIDLKRCAEACCLAVAGVLLASCGGGSGAVGTGGSGIRTYRSLLFTLTTPKRTYARGEPVPLTFTVTNIGPASVDTTYFTSATLMLQAALGSQVEWYQPQGGFEPSPHTYAPGETMTLEFAWAQVDLNNRPVPPGSYTISAWMPARTVGGATFTAQEDQVHLSAEPIQVTLQP